MKSLQNRVFLLVLALLALSAAACNTAAASPLNSPVFGDKNETKAATNVATATQLPATSTPEATETSLPSLFATPSLRPPSLTPTPAPEQVSPVACQDAVCSYPDVLFLQRPIAPPGRDTIDISYRFGTTQDGKHDPHHGVEFLNSSGTPVLAAAGGVVVFAGDDRQVFYGPYSYFYGNLVILEHQPPPGLPAEYQRSTLYTLYAHLSEILVEEGQTVRAGEEIGKVGMSGVATGSHLHFEVRIGSLDYSASRNPELWLKPLSGPDGQTMAALAGRVLDEAGEPMEVPSLVLEHLAGPDGPVDRIDYLAAYEEAGLLGQPPWEENFAAGDLLPGHYRLSFVQRGMQAIRFDLEPGRLTVLTIRLGSPEAGSTP